jgi:serine/threonine-protein kinase
MPFPPGTVLAGKYRVDRLLGEGGMGWVVVATHLQLEQRVALKFMRAAGGMGSTEAIRRFIREGRAAARIQSEHVARVSDVGTLESGVPYLVMEYLEGQDLDSLLREQPQLPVPVAIDYAIQACEGLSEVHAAGIVHRDLKPANVFLARRSDGSVRVKLLDFGISKISAGPGAPQEGSMTTTQALMGSPLYMAPEQMRSSKSVDARADIWSMGVIVYEMLAGHSPFPGDTLPEVCARILAEPPAPLQDDRSDVPPELEALVLKCLAKDSRERFQDVSELAGALAEFAPPQSRGAADRIERLVRARPPMLSDRSMATTTPQGVARRKREVSSTAAAFGTADPEPTSRRSRALPLVAGAGVLAVGAVIAIFAARGSAPPSTVSSASARQPPGAASVTSSASSGDLGWASLDGAAVAVLSALATAPSSPAPPAARPEATAVASATARPHAMKHPPAPPATVTSKPASTSAFGGRD